jgi:hypothetical protein
VQTGIARALVNVNGTSRATPTCASAVTRESSHQIRAGGSVEARLNKTIVEIDVAQVSNPAVDALTSEAVDTVTAYTTIKARCAIAFIDVNSTVFTSIASVTVAGIVADIDIRTGVGTVCAPNCLKWPVKARC